VLNLVDPIGADGHLVGARWDAGRDEAPGLGSLLAREAGNRQATTCQPWDAGPMYLGIERRATSRCLGPRPCAILLKADTIIECTVRDFSLGGVGIELPAAISILSTEFDLTFGQFTRRCGTAWRQADRLGLKVRSTRFAP
jgi:hypothetical protein